MYSVLIFFVCCGYVQLFASAINRFHTFAWNRRKLDVGTTILFVGLALTCVVVYLVLCSGDGSALGSDPVRSSVVAVGLIGIGIRIKATSDWWRTTLPSTVVEKIVEKHVLNRQQVQKYRGDGPKRWQLSIPGNESLSWELTRLKIQMGTVPTSWSGTKILHLSDFHFQGEITRDWFEGICRECAKLDAELIVFTGDLLDNMDCLDWFATTLGLLSCPLGCYFLLGNHDWHLDDMVVRERFETFGWTDLSGKSRRLIHKGEPFSIAGDETPWMNEPPEWPLERDGFRLLLSHTPDHFPRAVADGVDLMLAGHTHGGQVVLPLIGPVLSPSRYGTKYCGGQYELGGLFLNVSRGLSANDPLRIGAPPEVCLIELRSSPLGEV